MAQPPALTFRLVSFGVPELLLDPDMFPVSQNAGYLRVELCAICKSVGCTPLAT